MDNSEVINLLKRVLANQVILFKKIEDIEQKVKGGFRSAPLTSYERELSREADKLLNKSDL